MALLSPFFRRTIAANDEPSTASQGGAAATIERLFPFWRQQLERVAVVNSWMGPEPPKPYIPLDHANAEVSQLQEQSATPWLSLVVTSTAQSLYVEDYRDPNAPQSAAAWQKIWQPNGLDARQIPLHRGAIGHGQAFTLAKRGRNALTGQPSAVIRGFSPGKMLVEFQDDEFDDFPMFAMTVKQSNEIDPSTGAQSDRMNVSLVDDQRIWYFQTDADGKRPTYLSYEVHGAPYVPVTRFANMLDLEDDTTGEVEPLIPLAARINQDTFDRLIVQRYGAWVVRWIAGLNPPDSLTDKRAEEIRLMVKDILIAGDPDTKFGTLPGTPMDGYINARNADIKDLAAVSQTPPHHLLGLSPNLSAEALAAAESALMRKIDERKHLFGEAWERTVRTAAYISGDLPAAEDYSAQVVWKDVESRSMAQVADALGKLASQLNVPVQMLWGRIPGWTRQDTEEAKQLIEQAIADNSLDQILAAAGVPAPNPQPDVQPAPAAA